jgi:hypothetical protein
MVAVSKAPSPESNPDSPLPVNTMAVQYTANKLIGQILECNFGTTRASDKLAYPELAKNQERFCEDKCTVREDGFGHVLAQQLAQLSV